MSNITNRADQLTADQGLINGLTKHQSTLPTLLIGGTSYTAATAITIVQQRVVAAQAVAPAKAAWQAAVKADTNELASTKAFVSGLRQALLLAYASSPTTLADFGLAPHKTPAPRTPAEKAAAAAKAKATRAARHTMGKKQKLAITGTVTAPLSPPQPPAATSTAQAVPASPAAQVTTTTVVTPHP